MKSLSLSLLALSLTLIAVPAHAVQDVRDNFGGHYLTYDEPWLTEGQKRVESLPSFVEELPFAESLPFVGDDIKKTSQQTKDKKEYCEKTVKKACRVRQDVAGELFKMDAYMCSQVLPEAPVGTYDGGACPRACLAWADDCKDLVDENDLKRIFAEELK